MSPSFDSVHKPGSDFKVLAMGAMLKSTFGITHQKRIYISQFLGDTGMLESQLSYETTLDHMINLLNFNPSVILTDSHPDYPSTILGKTIAGRSGIPDFKIQHHEAHSFAVLAENDLLDEKPAVKNEQGG